MLTIHHLGVSQSERIIWLCEELEIPYELKLYARDPMMAPPEYKALHPMGIAPVITEDDLTLGESGAIIAYINAKYGNGRLAVEPNHKDYANYLYWFHFANATLLPTESFGFMIHMLAIPADSAPAISVADRARRSYELMENWLSTHDYFAGSEFSAADINMFFPLTTMRTYSRRDLSAYPSIRAYLQRVGSRPAYRRAMAKGDPELPLMLN